MSKDIGVIVPTITNPFYSYSVLGMEEEANKNDYNLLLCNTLRDPKREAMYLKMMLEKQVKGIVLSSVGAERNACKRVNQPGYQICTARPETSDMNCVATLALIY